MFMNLILGILGLVFLVYSANKLVEAASNLALSFGVSKLTIGLTIVAAGTSLPELVVSLNSVLKRSPQLSLGNVVGSNIINIILILGVTALITPINTTKAIVKREVPIMIAMTALVWLFSKTGLIITPIEGLILFLLFIIYNIISYIVGKRETKLTNEYIEEADKIIDNSKISKNKKEDTDENTESNNETKHSVMFNLLSIIGGLAGMLIGSELLVRSSINIANAIGVSGEVIGLTIIALGTSLPELATSVVAARKGQSDLAIGNVLGSNIFNITVITGLSSIIPFFFNNPDISMNMTISTEMIRVHIPIMMIAAVVLLPITITDMKISRYEGAFFLIIYICYTIMLFQMTNNTLKEHSTSINNQNIQIQNQNIR